MISNYDKFDYDYKTYWKNRRYENESERLAIEKLLKSVKGDLFLDIGGSYGRLIPTYYGKFKHSIIVDYSLKTLQKNLPSIKEKFPNTELVAANVYAMPFTQNSFDAAMMIRVLHHIDRPDKYFEELSLIMRPKSIYLQEFANIHHLKALLRAVLTANFGLFRLKRYQQPSQGNFEGSKGHETTFLNFSHTYVKDEMSKAGFILQRTLGTSFLRIPLLKKFVPLEALLFLEKILQSFFSWTKISPSIILRTKLIKGGEDKTLSFNTLEDVLFCPKCKGSLSFKNGEATCKKCGRTYQRKSGVWDMRVNTDET